MIFNKTGLLIDSYFSGTKIKWILDNVSKAKQLMNKKQLLFGTIDSFLIWRLTRGKIHATDATNASRTMIYNISSNKWDDTILSLLKMIFFSFIGKFRNAAIKANDASKIHM